MDEFGYDRLKKIIKIGDFVEILPTNYAEIIQCSWCGYEFFKGKINQIFNDIVLIKLFTGDFIYVPCSEIVKCEPVKIHFKFFNKKTLNNICLINIELKKMELLDERYKKIDKLRKIKKAIEKKCLRT